jgi:hypothetical protein
MATVDDIERIDSLELEDFAMDTSKVRIPSGRRLSDTERQTAVDDFIAAL